jgi:hypothetical protein
MQAFLEAGFILREDIVKYQWKTKTTREKWGGLTKVAEECWVNIDKTNKKYYMDFYLLYYEHLFIFRKPEKDEDIRSYKDSMIWSNNQPMNNQIQLEQTDKSSLTNTTNIETFKTKLNPYGFIYIPKNALPKLPFKTGDKLQLKIDKTKRCILITPS